MEEYTFINPDNGDSFVLRMEQDLELGGLWRVYAKGDRNTKPLHTSRDADAARKVYEETKAALVERSKA